MVDRSKYLFFSPSSRFSPFSPLHTAVIYEATLPLLARELGFDRVDAHVRLHDIRLAIAQLSAWVLQRRYWGPLLNVGVGIGGNKKRVEKEELSEAV